MKTVEINLYKFSELSEKAQAKALDKLRDINVDYTGWYDFVYDDAKTIAALMGIEIDKIYFTGFASQGDGACFEGSYSYRKDSVKAVKEYAPQDAKLHRIAEYLQRIQKKYFYRLSATVKHSGHYYHENCTEINVYNADDYANEEAEEEIKDCLRDFMRWIYSSLETEYDYQTSEEAIIETIEANSYEFTEDGKLY